MKNDLISRSALKEEFKKIYHCAETAEELANTMEDAIDNAPTVTIKEWIEEMPIYIKDAMLEALRPQGEWTHSPVTFGTCFLQGYQCNCGRIVMQRENFCPDCGADMRGGVNNG